MSEPYPIPTEEMFPELFLPVRSRKKIGTRGRFVKLPDILATAEVGEPGSYIGNYMEDQGPTFSPAGVISSPNLGSWKGVRRNPSRGMAEQPRIKLGIATRVDTFRIIEGRFLRNCNKKHQKTSGVQDQWKENNKSRTKFNAENIKDFQKKTEAKVAWLNLFFPKIFKSQKKSLTKALSDLVLPKFLLDSPWFSSFPSSPVGGL